MQAVSHSAQSQFAQHAVSGMKTNVHFSSELPGIITKGHTLTLIHSTIYSQEEGKLAIAREVGILFRYVPATYP